MSVVPFSPRNSGPSRPGGSSGVIAVLDAGSSKIACLLAKRCRDANGEPSAKIIGYAHQEARGFRKGAVADLDLAERSIRLAVDAAERMAGVTVSEVYVAISGGRAQSVPVQASIKTGGRAVTEEDLNRLIDKALRNLKLENRELIYAAPIDFELDDTQGVTSPTGMFANHVGVSISCITIEPWALRNLEMVIERCHLSVAGFVLGSYAAALGATHQDERELGVTVIDIGAATTSVSIFSNGHMLSAETLPVGGQHITRDLAHGLTTSIAHAERLKTRCGSVLMSSADDRELLTVPLVGEAGPDAVVQVQRSLLVGLIRPRAEEILEMVRDCLEFNPLAARAGRLAVITGGSSHLIGMREAAQHILERNVRTAGPLTFDGWPKSMSGPGFVVASGLIACVLRPRAKIIPKTGRPGGYLKRVGSWFC